MKKRGGRKPNKKLGNEELENETDIEDEYFGDEDAFDSETDNEDDFRDAPTPNPNTPIENIPNIIIFHQLENSYLKFSQDCDALGLSADALLGNDTTAMETLVEVTQSEENDKKVAAARITEYTQKYESLNADEKGNLIEKINTIKEGLINTQEQFSNRAEQPQQGLRQTMQEQPPILMLKNESHQKELCGQYVEACTKLDLSATATLALGTGELLEKAISISKDTLPQNENLAAVNTITEFRKTYATYDKKNKAAVIEVISTLILEQEEIKKAEIASDQEEEKPVAKAKTDEKEKSQAPIGPTFKEMLRAYSANFNSKSNQDVAEKRKELANKGNDPIRKVRDDSILGYGYEISDPTGENCGWAVDQLLKDKKDTSAEAIKGFDAAAKKLEGAPPEDKDAISEFVTATNNLIHVKDLWSADQETILKKLTAAKGTMTTFKSSEKLLSNVDKAITELEESILKSQEDPKTKTPSFHLTVDHSNPLNAFLGIKEMGLTRVARIESMEYEQSKTLTARFEKEFVRIKGNLTGNKEAKTTTEGILDDYKEQYNEMVDKRAELMKDINFDFESSNVLKQSKDVLKQEMKLARFVQKKADQRWEKKVKSYRVTPVASGPEAFANFWKNHVWKSWTPASYLIQTNGSVYTGKEIIASVIKTRINNDENREVIMADAITAIAAEKEDTLSSESRNNLIRDIIDTCKPKKNTDTMKITDEKLPAFFEPTIDAVLKKDNGLSAVDKLSILMILKEKGANVDVQMTRAKKLVKSETTEILKKEGEDIDNKLEQIKEITDHKIPELTQLVSEAVNESNAIDEIDKAFIQTEIGTPQKIDETKGLTTEMDTKLEEISNRLETLVNDEPQRQEIQDFEKTMAPLKKIVTIANSDKKFRAQREQIRAIKELKRKILAKPITNMENKIKKHQKMIESLAKQRTKNQDLKEQLGTIKELHDQVENPDEATLKLDKLQKESASKVKELAEIEELCTAIKTPESGQGMTILSELGTADSKNQKDLNTLIDKFNKKHKTDLAKIDDQSGITENVRLSANKLSTQVTNLKTKIETEAKEARVTDLMEAVKDFNTENPDHAINGITDEGQDDDVAAIAIGIEESIDNVNIAQERCGETIKDEEKKILDLKKGLTEAKKRPKSSPKVIAVAEKVSDEMKKSPKKTAKDILKKLEKEARNNKDEKIGQTGELSAIQTLQGLEAAGVSVELMNTISEEFDDAWTGTDAYERGKESVSSGFSSVKSGAGKVFTAVGHAAGKISPLCCFKKKTTENIKNAADKTNEKEREQTNVVSADMRSNALANK